MLARHHHPAHLEYLLEIVATGRQHVAVGFDETPATVDRHINKILVQPKVVQGRQHMRWKAIPTDTEAGGGHSVPNTLPPLS